MIYLILGKGSYNGIWLGLYSSISKTLQISEYHMSSILSWGSCVPLQESLFDKRTPLRFSCASLRFSVICPWFSVVHPWFSVDRLCVFLRYIINKQDHNNLWAFLKLVPGDYVSVIYTRVYCWQRLVYLLNQDTTPTINKHCQHLGYDTCGKDKQV